MLICVRHRFHGQVASHSIQPLVVILIIGILAAVAIPAFLNQKGKANDANVSRTSTPRRLRRRRSSLTGQAYSQTNSDLTSIEPTLTQAFGTVAPAVATPLR